MRLEWLEDILAIARTGSFVAAAERRSLTQSAFSRRVQQIEDHVGVELFDRSHKPVQLRPTTLAQSTQIEQLASAIRQLEVDLRRGEQIASNQIMLASQHSLTACLAPTLIQELQDVRKDVFVRLRSANLDECFALLLSRQADLAIVYHQPDVVSEFKENFIETCNIGSDRLIPVYASKHCARITDTTAHLPYVAYPLDVFFGKVMEHRILPHLTNASTAHPKVETALTFAALEMAVLGVAVAWVPMSMAQERIALGSIVDLSDSWPSCELSVRAIRLQGQHGSAERALWAQMASTDRAK